MKIVFRNTKELENEFNNIALHKCPICNGCREISMEPLEVSIDRRKLSFELMPILKCIKCNNETLSYYVKNHIINGYELMRVKNSFSESYRYRGYNKRFNYCIKHNLEYDHRDYYSMPGLCHDDEHTEEGFLTPVYFSKKSLIYFMHDTDYILELFSETYGHIKYKDEWIIPFGINRNGKVIFWLGDLDSIDDTSLSILKPHNIESDHQLLTSEFYKGQMCCEFSEPNNELKICYKKESLFKILLEKYNLSLVHLDKEIKEQIHKFQKPLIINKKTIEPVINMLHKVLIEGVNIDNFKKLYLKINKNPDNGYKEWKSIKFYKAILKNILPPKSCIEDIIAPLYLLNDMRNYYDHLMSSRKKEDIQNNVVKSLGVNSFSDIEEIYFSIINRLNILFDHLIIGYMS